jgi:hypothetical protein
MGGLEVVHRDASLALAPSQNVLFVVWTGEVTGASVQALHDASLRLSRAHPRGIAHMNIVATGSAGAGLDETARKRFFALIRDPDVRLVASATVLSDGGFLAATIRSVLAGLALLALPGMKLKFFSDVEQAETWLRAALAASSADAPEAGAVRRTIAALRDVLGPDGARI